jgi:hypothetical protein
VYNQDLHFFLRASGSARNQLQGAVDAKGLHSKMSSCSYQRGARISDKPARSPYITKSNCLQSPLKRIRRKKHDVARLGGFAPVLPHQLRWETCSVRGGDQKPASWGQSPVQAGQCAARISKMLNDLQTRDSIELDCGGKTEKTAVGANTYTRQIVMPEWLDGSNISPPFLEFQSHGATASAVIEHTDTDEAAPA